METKLKIKLPYVAGLVILLSIFSCYANSKTTKLKEKDSSMKPHLIEQYPDKRPEIKDIKGELFRKRKFQQKIMTSSYDTIHVGEISINEFMYGNDIEKYKQFFGKPFKVESYIYEDGDGPDGYEKTFYINYKYLEIIYSVVYGKNVLENIQVSGLPYQVQLSKEFFSVGDSLNKLEMNFPESFKYFQEQYTKPYEQKEQSFYIYMILEFPDYIHYGLINITLKEDIITAFSFRFEEGT